ncbi:MAG: Hsp20/alpha crystallin family protein [Verrucomicrobiota bacterium]
MRLSTHTPSLHGNPFEAFFNDPFFGLNAPRLPLVKFSRQPSSLKLAADFYEDENAYFARVELPGVKRDEVKIELDKDVLTIAYERKSGSDENVESTSYQRAIRVPEGIQSDAIGAKLEDGILTLTLPKGEEAKPREIKVAYRTNQDLTLTITLK